MDIINTKLLTNKCFINGKWIESFNKEKIKVNNPATLEIIGEVPNCGKKETEEAIEAASKSFNNWKLKSAKERSIILKKWFR